MLFDKKKDMTPDLNMSHRKMFDFADVRPRTKKDVRPRTKKLTC